MSALYFQLITPERTLFDSEVVSITCQTGDGQITILPGHTQLISTLVPGEVVVKKPSGQEEILHAGGGILEVKSGQEVIMLADAAERLTEIDETRAKQAIANARQKLAQAKLTDREITGITAQMERNFTRLKITRKHAHRKTSPITGEGVLEE